MAAKSGILDLIFKSGAKAAKEVSRGTGSVAKKAPSNMKVVPPKTPTGTRGAIPRAKKYYAETGRPKIANGRPLPPSMGRPIPAKKAAPVKKMSPAKPTAEEFARMGKAAGAAKAARMPQKPAPAKKAVPVKKVDYEKRLRPFNPMASGSAKKPLPTKPSIPVKKFR